MKALKVKKEPKVFKEQMALKALKDPRVLLVKTEKREPKENKDRRVQLV